MTLASKISLPNNYPKVNPKKPQKKRSLPKEQRQKRLMEISRLVAERIYQLKVQQIQIEKKKNAPQKRKKMHSRETYMDILEKNNIKILNKAESQKKFRNELKAYLTVKRSKTQKPPF